MSHKKQVTIFEARAESQSLSILRSFPSLKLKESLVFQTNIKTLGKVEKKFNETETLLKERALAAKEDESLSPEQLKEINSEIDKDFQELLAKKYPVELGTVPLSSFPEDIASKPAKKVTLQNGQQVEVSYVDCLLESIGFSVEDTSPKEVEVQE